MFTTLRLMPVDDGIEAVCQVKHPLVKGDRNRDWHIEQMTFYVNQKIVTTCNFGNSISADPVVSILLTELEPTDTVAVRWSDSRSYTGYAEARMS